MASADPWSVFDYKYRLQRIAVTKGTVSAGGVLTAPTQVITTIYGNLVLDPQNADPGQRVLGDQRVPGGLYETGEARLHTDTVLKVGDIVRVSFDETNTVTEDFEVQGVAEVFTLMNASTIGGTKRREYRLTRKHTPGGL